MHDPAHRLHDRLLRLRLTPRRHDRAQRHGGPAAGRGGGGRRRWREGRVAGGRGEVGPRFHRRGGRGWLCCSSDGRRGPRRCPPETLGTGEGSRVSGGGRERRIWRRGGEVAEGGEVGAVLRAVHGRRGSPESVGVCGGSEEESWDRDREPQRAARGRGMDRG